MSAFYDRSCDSATVSPTFGIPNIIYVLDGLHSRSVRGPSYECLRSDAIYESWFQNLWGSLALVSMCSHVRALYLRMRINAMPHSRTQPFLRFGDKLRVPFPLLRLPRPCV
jgi:hypothetical protein